MEDRRARARARALAAAHAPVAARAHHVESSAAIGDEPAIALLVQAGRDAAPRAPETAGRWLLAATRLLPPTDDEQRRLSLLAEAAERADVRGRLRRGRSRCSTRRRALLAPERADERASLVARIAFAKRMSGRPFDSRALVERRLAVAAARQRAARWR